VADVALKVTGRLPASVTAEVHPRRSGALAAQLREIGLGAGLDAFGITTAEPFLATRQVLESRRAAGLDGGMQFTYRNPARSTDPESTLPGARSIVVGARGYLRTAPADPTDDEVAALPGGPAHGGEGSAQTSRDRPAGRVATFAWSDHYDALRQALAPVAEALRARGYRATILVDDNRMVDRAAAHRAGIGWYGKNTTLLLPRAGSWYVLGSVVTDAALATDEPVDDHCGSCDRCRPACPTGALVEPGVLDGRRCLAWLVQAPGLFPRQYREAVGDRIYGCDDCQDVCPVNRAASRRRPPPSADADDTVTVDVLALLAASDEEILARWGRWYIAERAPRWLRRNGLIVLGNTASPDDPDVVEALRAALGADDPMVRAHAVWAAARLGRDDLLARLASDPDPDVQAELAAAEAVPSSLDVVDTEPRDPARAQAVDGSRP
jgi:epoxyqueuosine reductase